MDAKLLAVEPAGDRLRLRWADGRATERHVVWLRDGCTCDACVDGFSSQRHLNTADIPDDLAVRSAKVEHGDLAIVWDPDGHESRYAPQALAPRELPNGRSNLWGADLRARVPRASFTEVSRDDRALARWLGDLRDLGVTVLGDTPNADGQVERVAELYGYVHEGNDGRHFEVVSSSKPTNFAYTPKTLALHTDRPFVDPVPGVQLLHCLAQSAEGGENMLVDGFNVAEKLRRADAPAFATLARIRATFRNRYDQVDLMARHPVIQLGHDGRVDAVHINDRAMRPVEAEGADVPAFYRAYRTFFALVRDPANQITVKLRPGDVLVFDNRRVLHGRAGYDASTSHRHLQGCYTDWCYVESKLRMLAVEIGDWSNGR